MFPLYDTNPHYRTPWLTMLIIAANLLMMLLVQQMPPQQQFELFARYGFVPKRIEQLSDPKLVVEIKVPDLPPGVVAPQFRPVQLPAEPSQVFLSLLTMMFLHGGWLHVIGNMWFLWIFGNNIEDRLGHVLFVVFYLMGGLLAAGCHWLNDPGSSIPAIGASGAVAAVLGAYAVTFPKAKVRCLIFLVVFISVIDLPAMVVLGLWFLKELLFAIDERMHGGQSGIAFWAHVGGFAAGMILMPLMSLGAPPPGENWKKEAEEMFRFDHHDQ